MPRTGRPPKTKWAICLVSDCSRSVKGGAKGFCPSHYQQARKGLIDEDGNETGKRTRLHRKGTPCLADGCTSPAVGRGLCNRHYQQEETVVANRKARQQDDRCILCNAPHWARGFCHTHYVQLRRGIIDEEGNLLRPLKRVSRIDEDAVCRQPGCKDQVRTRGWCNKHYMQFRAGIINEEGKKLRELQPRGRRPLDFRKEIAGYILVRAPEGHPFARQDGSILEHRLVAEKKAGCFLDPDEFLVHHKNGIRHDNHPDNVEVKPYKAHGPGKDADVETNRRSLFALRCNDPKAFKKLIRSLK